MDVSVHTLNHRLASSREIDRLVSTFLVSAMTHANLQQNSVRSESFQHH